MQILGGRGKNIHTLHESLDFDTLYIKCFKRGNSDDKQGHNNLLSELFASVQGLSKITFQICGHHPRSVPPSFPLGALLWLIKREESFSNSLLHI